MTFNWLALAIGNSRLHWGLFTDEKLISAWDSEYVAEFVVEKLARFRTPKDFPSEIYSGKNQVRKIQDRKIQEILPFVNQAIPLILASVVPEQTKIWQTYPNVSVVTLDLIPFNRIYPSLGIDRILSLWGAVENWGFPMLVIDSGTALTFTAADHNYNLVGGEILPGFNLQLESLTERTGLLPKIELPQELPQRYALDTYTAIQSGVIYTLLAGIEDFIRDWCRLFPDGKIAITGGDRNLLIKYLQSQKPEIANIVKVEPHLIFWGMRCWKQKLKI